MSTKTIDNTPEGFRVLLSAVQKVRSIAAEGEYGDLMADQNIGGIKVRGLAPTVANPKTIELLVDCASGDRTIDESGFRNLCWMLRREGLDVALAVHGYTLPEMFA